MNRHEVRGGVRDVAGKADQAFGDAVDRRDWQATGIVDHMSGEAEALFGRARNAVRGMADATPGRVEDAPVRAGDAAARIVEAGRLSARAPRDALDGREARLRATATARGGSTPGWPIHGRCG